jgi:hypothetical protein
VRPILTYNLPSRNGRWRSLYLFDTSSGSLEGTIKVDVHYYEDGNVRLLTNKPVSASLSTSASSADITKQIAIFEKRYQEELNRAFSSLSEGAFKGLRRQLPVTRQKIEWEKISGYRVSVFHFIEQKSSLIHFAYKVGSRYRRRTVKVIFTVAIVRRREPVCADGRSDMS